MNSTKPFLLVLFAFLFTPISFAANLTFTSNTIINIGGNEYIIHANSEATQISVGTTSIVIEIPADSSVTISSSNFYTLESNVVGSLGCNSEYSFITIDGPKTATITPVEVESPSCSSGSSGGGGGGSNRSKDWKPKLDLPKGCLPGFKFSPETGKSCGEAASLSQNISTTTIIPTVSGVAAGGIYSFGQTTVKLNTKGESCKAWQKFLNDKIDAKLSLDGWCGKLTIAAAKKWQASVGLVADGFLGPMSRARAMQ